MSRKYLLLTLILSLSWFCRNTIASAAPPVAIGQFTKIYDPSIGEKESWYINDHCFIYGIDSLWHLFGITHAEPSNPWDERNFAHAVATTLTQKQWHKLPVALTAEWQKWHETQLWAPYVMFYNGTYYIYYCAGGKTVSQYEIHLATSTDLKIWTRHPKNPMFVDGMFARDPFILRVGNKWIMYYAATSEPTGGKYIIAWRMSDDLVTWGERNIAYIEPTSKLAESPFVVNRGVYYYLFICPRGDDFGTDVFRSTSPYNWTAEDTVAHFNAQAPEIIRDLDGKWYLSRCGTGRGGVYLAPLSWNDGMDTAGSSIPIPRNK